MPKVIKFFVLLAATVLAVLLCRWTGALPFNFKQSLSILVFSTFIYGTLLYGDQIDWGNVSADHVVWGSLDSTLSALSASNSLWSPVF